MVDKKKPRKRVTFLGREDIDEAISEIAARVGRMPGNSVALVGGVAMQVYGSDRLTRDVDIAVVEDAAFGWKGRGLLSFGGYSVTTPKGHPVDIVVRDDAYTGLYVEAVEQAVDEGLALPVATAEHLYAMKMVAGREKDHLDMRKLLLLGVIDDGALRDILREHLGPYAVTEMERFIEETEFLKSRGEE